MQQVSKEAVNYRLAEDGRRCGTCDMFNATSGTCDLVEGSIDADHVCDRWEPIPLKESKSVTVTDVNERPVYGPGSRQSFYRDLLVISGHLGAETWVVQEARDRLSRYADKSERTMRMETRAMSSGSSSGGAFVTPEYLVDDFALFLSPLSSFAAQCTSIPDEGVGLQMNVPGISAGATTGQQAGENQGAPGSGDAAAGYLSTPLTTQIGEQLVSQQLIDRSGPLGFDKVMSMQLGDQLRAAVDTYVVGNAIAQGTAVAGAATFSNANLWGDIQKAGEQMLDANGNELVPTHFFAVPKQIQFFMAQVDSQQRPLMTPTPEGAWTPDVKDPSGQPAGGATGLNIIGLSVYRDGNIPAATGGANAQLLVARPSEFFVQCSEPYFRVVVEEYAGSLSVLVQAYCYAGVVARHATACQVITGAGYPVSPTFA